MADNFIMPFALKQDLNYESIVRSTVGGYFQILSALVVWATFTQVKSYPWPWHMTLFVIVALSLYRIILKLSIRKKSKTEQASYFYYFMTPMMISALIWGLFASSTILTEGMRSNESIAVTLIVMAFTCGVLNSLAPSSKARTLYSLLTGAPIILSLFYSSNNAFDFVFGLCFLLLFSYMLVIGRSISKSYVSSVELKLDLIKQRSKLQHIVNSVPGFIAVSNAELKWIDYSESFNGLVENSELRKIQAEFLSSNKTHDSLEIDLPLEQKIQSFMISMAKLEQPEPGAIFVAAPINEFKKMRTQLEVQRANSEFNSRMATLGEMASGIAHEINNPLAIISGNASQIKRLLPDQLKEDSQLNHKIESIIKTSFRISKIIHALKTFARQGQGDPFETIQLQHVVQDSLELCQQRFKNHGIELLVDPVPGIEFQGRAVQICQILVNLLSNAFDILIEQELRIIKIEFQTDSQFVMIAIEDNGKGIPQHIQDKIFEPFFTTKEVGKGTGLGLSICRGILEDHKGEIKLSSKPGRTRFEIKLPIQQKNQHVA